MTVGQRKSEIFAQRRPAGIVMLIRDVHVDEAEGRVTSLDVVLAPPDPLSYSIKTPVLDLTDFAEKTRGKPAQSGANVHDTTGLGVREFRDEPPCFGAGRVQEEIIRGVFRPTHSATRSRAR